MSVTWEHLAGDTGRFAFKVALLRDPDEPTGASPDDAASWGAIQIWVRGHNLCLHTEQGTSVESVHWYLLPLLEWLIESWDPLLHEERLPVENAADSGWEGMWATRFPKLGLSEHKAEAWDAAWSRWWSRHCLHAGRDGGLLPDLCLRRWRDQVEISWGHSVLPGEPDDYRFASPTGCVRMEPSDVASPLATVLGATLDELQRRFPDSRRLQSLRARLDALRQESRTEARLAWLAGLGGTERTQRKNWKRILAAFQGAPRRARDAVLATTSGPFVIEGTCQAALMFGSTEPSIGDRDVMLLARKLLDLYAPATESAELRGMGEDTPPSAWNETSWEQGHHLAERALQQLETVDTRQSWVDIDAVYDRLGIHRESVTLQDASIRAVAVAGPDHRPAVLLNESYPGGGRRDVRRFTLAHELCHLLADRQHGRRLAMATGPWAPPDVERRANSFAAMFLMPPELIRRALRRDVRSLKDVSELSNAMRTSLTATLEHLGNLGFIQSSTRDQLRHDLENRMANA